MFRNSTAKLLLLLTFVSLASCSPFFVMRAAYEESKILLAREEITNVINSDKTEEDEKQKLYLVLDAREFSKQMELTPKDSFTLYTKLDKSPLAWVYVASMPDSFTVKTWWFPFVGSVPYKGYFSKDDALSAAESAKKDGWETWIRGTDAFSTLGWFNDPILSTTLSRDKFTIVNTVIHEIFHSTIWVKNHVDFNESAANFVGAYGMLDYFKAKYSACFPKGAVCSKELEDVKQARRVTERDADMAETVDKMFEALNELYQSDLEKEEILTKRQGVFQELSQPLKQKYPELKIFKQANNAELMQLKIYMTGFDDFKKLYFACSEDWPCFLSRIRLAAEKAAEDGSSPFDHI